MTTKAKAHALNMHTAGIFSDMTVDGPEIGTLVLVVDRAKNLPNRKTIGKQDPYCAARLGKEAKKTTTDIRGGQTPKWDQELRFTVHDSPDYYQLKVSVFNDDKRTELIGEAWIDLRDIVVPGGGQSDQWHQLGCRGKYAGEVRIETTYYDTRPKPEKPVVKAKPPVAAEPEAAPAAAGPRPIPKRRPLPSDPVTGKAPAAPEQTEVPPKPQQNPAPLPQQPPVAQSEYSQAPPAPGQQYYQQPDPNREFGTSSRRPDAPAQQYRTPDRAEQYAAQPDQGYSTHQQQPSYDRHDSFNPPQASDTRAVEDDRPPPPPAHRSRTGSNPSMNAAFQATPPTMRQDVLRSEAHRNSVSASYPGRPTYKAYDSAPAGMAGPQYANADQGQAPVRHYSYDPAYEPHRTMQATVEDVPESPESMSNPHRKTSGRWPISASQSQPQFEPDYDLTASPAPLTFSGRGGNDSARYPPDPRYQGSNGYQTSPSEFPRKESPEYAPNYGRHSEPALPTHGSHSDQKALTYRGEINDNPPSYSVPPVPPSLVPGIDPSIAQEITERINQDRMQSTQTRGYTQQALVETPPRGRTMDSRYGHEAPAAAYNGVSAHSRSPIMYTNGPSTSSVNVVIKSRAYSPNPPREVSPNPRQHTIRRKSVSPRPPTESDRALSSVPFGPDSYEALNPNASAAALKDAAASRPDYREETGKIITHDGREVDPSDHLPMETWAPEPEPKQPSSSSTSARPSPSGPQPVPASGRRPLRIAGRPQSMLPSSSAISFSSSTDHVEPITPSPPVSTGRNRLQKKAAYRQSTSAIAPVMSGANGPGPSAPLQPRPGSSSNTGSVGVGSAGFRRSSGASGHANHDINMEPVPLAPIPPHQDNFTPPRQISRASTFDYAAGVSNENYAPGAHSHSGSGVYGTSPGSQRYGNGHSPGHGNGQGHGYSRSGGNASYGTGPPIPAKVPLALPAPGGGAAGVGSGALQLHSSSAARRAGLDDYGHGNGGGGNGGPLSLEEELRQIDIGTGRSSRRRDAQGYGHGHGHGHGNQGYGAVYGQGGY